MPELRMKEVTHYVVDYGDLESFVEEVTGRTYEFVALQECGNDSDHEFSIGKRPVDDYDRAAIENWLSGDDGALQYQPQLALEHLAEQGLIPRGDYLIQVCW